MQVVILLAGQGKRMGLLTQNNHKSLLMIRENETFLSYLLHQIGEYPVSKVILVTGYQAKLIEDVAKRYHIDIELVYNERYKEDTNIYSLKLAMDNINPEEPVLIIEGDVYMDDLAVRKVFESGQQDKSIWFTKGVFNANQYGGILKTIDRGKQIVEIKIVKQYLDKYKNYNKLLGIMIVGAKEVPIFKDLLKKYSVKTIEQYYLIPWIENLSLLPCEKVDLSDYYIESVNSADEYYRFVEELEKNASGVGDVELIELSKLKPIEGCVISHTEMLFGIISESKSWIKPIVVEKKNNLVLDGHHRFEVAKKMRLKFIPVVFVDYNDVDIWTLRKSELVEHRIVIERALNGDIYPEKTVKHRFPFQIPSCSVLIDNLR